MSPTKLSKEEKEKKVNANNRKIIFQGVTNERKVSRNSAWGALCRRTIANFYVGRDVKPDHLLFMATKCRKRHNWSHKEVLRRCHPKPPDPKNNENAVAIDLVLCYLTKGLAGTEEKYNNLTGSIEEPVSNIFAKIKLYHEVRTIRFCDQGIERLLKLLDENVKREVQSELEYSCTRNYLKPDSPTGSSEGFKLPFHIVKEHIQPLFLSPISSKPVSKWLYYFKFVLSDI